MAERMVIAKSPLGIVVDGVDLGRGARPGRIELYGAHETYAARGAFPGGQSFSRGPGPGSAYGNQLRFHDRHSRLRRWRCVPLHRSRRRPCRAPDEATGFRLVPGEHSLVPQPPRALRRGLRQEARRRAPARRVGRASADNQATRRSGLRGDHRSGPRRIRRHGPSSGRQARVRRTPWPRTPGRHILSNFDTKTTCIAWNASRRLPGPSLHPGGS